MNHSKIICFDFDGTLVQPGEIIHPLDITILKSAWRYPFVLATGRALPSIRGTFAKNDLYIDTPIPFPIVAQNGSVIYDEGEVQLAEFVFPNDILQPLLVLIGGYPEVIFYIFETNFIHLLHPSQEAIRSAEYYSMPLRFDNKLTDAQINKILASSPQPELLKRVSHTISHLDVEFSLSLSHLLEITPKGVNKASGFDRLISILNLRHPSTYFAGDGENDLSLLNRADFSFAPSNSIEAVRKSADKIIDIKQGGLLSPILEYAGYLKSE